MSDERIPDDIMRTAEMVEQHCVDASWNTPPKEARAACELIVARAILAERNRVHKQLKGEGTA